MKLRHVSLFQLANVPVTVLYRTVTGTGSYHLNRISGCTGTIPYGTVLVPNMSYWTTSYGTGSINSTRCIINCTGTTMNTLHGSFIDILLTI